MKLSVNEHGNICLEEVFNGVELKAASGESIGICMRDDGFELRIGDNHRDWYSIQHGQIKPLFTTREESDCNCTLVMTSELNQLREDSRKLHGFIGIQKMIKQFYSCGQELISITELNQLRADSDKLKKLESAGVDNWEGYDEALINGL